MDGDYVRRMQEGTFDSSGTFTLDRQRRERAVVRLVELGPYIFLGRFLQAATAEAS